MRLHPVRVELQEANAFVTSHHRHHQKVAGHRFSLGVGADGRLAGVAICGRPVGRGADQRSILEVLRCCTDGTPNACSWLYTAAARCAREMGFRAVMTYTSASEPGISLRACGWWPQTLHLRIDYSFQGGGRERLPGKGKDLGQKIRWCFLTGND